MSADHASASARYDFDVEDVEYLRHGDQPLLVRLFKPRGPGPFPAVVEVHGGAWGEGDRTREVTRHEALAKTGIVVAALDFRQAAEGAYPLATADINYGVRWVKAHAEELKTRPEMVGICGQSSGGHQAMLVAIRPHDPRYNQPALPAGSPDVDATVRCVVVQWPVINPLGRYREAKRLRDGPKPPEWPTSVLRRHDLFWGTEANMADGNPMLALERGEPIAKPPTLWIQCYNDPVHDYHDPESDGPDTESVRFAKKYRKAGGEIEVVYYNAPLRFTQFHEDMPETADAFARISRFFHQHLSAKTAAQARVPA